MRLATVFNAAREGVEGDFFAPELKWVWHPCSSLCLIAKQFSQNIYNLELETCQKFQNIYY